ncbi:putative cytosol aminopeptidase, partial [Tetrabaena socialis]
VLDFATLTSYATQLCCDLSAAYYTVNDALSQLVFSIGEAIGERVWRHPPWPEYKLNTMSPVADSRNAHFDCTRLGSFMAAMFISNFVQGEVAERWVHFDIANNDVKGVHSANCAFMGMQLVKALAEVGTKRADYRVSRKSKTVKKVRKVK